MTNEEIIVKLLKQVFERDAFISELREEAEEIYHEAKREIPHEVGLHNNLLSQIINLSNKLDDRMYLDGDNE